MSTALTLVAALLAVFTLCACLDLLFGVGSMARLDRQPVLPQQLQPLVSVIVPAKDEASRIRQAMTSLLALDYARVEIIAINDRSTDRTGEILDAMAASHPQLRVLHLQELEQGWLGKTQAMHQAALMATGDYLLFTDADVHFAGSALARAMSRVQEKKLDHVAVIFGNRSPGWLLNSLILDAGASLLQLLRPWRACDPKSESFVGVGAFNLVSRSLYQQVGGHASIAMHPVDDLMLGRLLKEAGGRQECLLGSSLVSVPWYQNVPAMMDGLMKNVLALINYRLSLLPLLVLAAVTGTILPLWGAFLADSPAALLFALAVLTRTLTFWAGTKLLSISPWCTLGSLITPYLNVYILLRAGYKNFQDDGIIWRGTHYPLTVLQANRPVLGRLRRKTPV